MTVCLLTITHLVEISSRKGVLLTWYNHNGVTSDDSWSEQRHEGQQRILIWAGYANHPDRFIDTHYAAIHGGFLGGLGVGYTGVKRC